MWLRAIAGVLATAVCAGLALNYVTRSSSVFLEGDARYYLGIATGDYSQVMQPFASRQMGPLVVAAMMRALHWTVERAYLVEGGVSFAVMSGAVFWLMLKTRAPRWLLLAVAIVPFWTGLLQELVLPDLWYSALLGLMFLMLANEEWMAASLMMFPLMMSRESTSLTLVCLLIAGWKRFRWKHRVIAVVTAVAASLIVRHLAERAKPNLESLPELVYMVAKVPWNFMGNVLGLVPWSNINQEYCRVPRWQIPLRFGHVTAVGVCGYSFGGLELLALAVMTSFGTLPVLAAMLWWRCRKARVESVLLRFALLYGGISLLLAPELGTWVARLVGYAWPLFFVALPMLFNEVSGGEMTTLRAVAAAGFVASEVLLRYVPYQWSTQAQVVADAGIWLVAYMLLRAWLGEDYRPLNADAHGTDR